MRISSKILSKNPAVGVMDKILTKRGNFKFEKVTDTFYRGSDVTTQEFPELAKAGIKKIINLKTISKKEIEKLTKAAQENGMDFRNIPLDPFRPKKYIEAIAEEAKSPIPKFFHCTFGIDRTGISAGVQRIVDGMPMFKAMKEMQEHGYNTYHRLVFFPMEQALRKFAQQNITIK